jgi:hypothetical protein
MPFDRTASLWLYKTNGYQARYSDWYYTGLRIVGSQHTNSIGVGSRQILLNDATGFTTNDLIYMTEGTGEFARVSGVTNTEVTVHDPFLYSHISTNTFPPYGTNLVALWRMENNWTDYTGVYTGYAFGGATFTTTSKVGVAAGKFNGSSAYVLASNNFPHQAFSIGMWMWPSNIYGASSRALFSIGTGTTTRFWLIGGGNYQDAAYRTNAFQAMYAQDGVSTTSASNTLTSADVGSWHYIVYTHDTSANPQNAFYKDGVLLPLMFDTASNEVLGANSSIKIGTRFDNNQYWNGFIDEASLFNKALSSNEQYNLYTFMSGMFFNYGGVSRVAEVLDKGYINTSGDKRLYGKLEFTNSTTADVKIKLDYTH